MEYTDEELAQMAGVKLKGPVIPDDELARVAGVKLKPIKGSPVVNTPYSPLPKRTVSEGPPLDKMAEDMLSGIGSFSDLIAPPPSIGDVKNQVAGERSFQNTLAEKSWKARLLPTPENVSSAKSYGLQKNPVGEFPNTATYERTHNPNFIQKAADVSGAIVKSAAEARTLGMVPMPGNKYESSPVSGLSNLAGFMLGFPSGLLHTPVKTWITEVTPKLQKEWFGRTLTAALSDIPAGAAYGVGHQIGTVSQGGKWSWADASKEAAVWGLMGAVVGGGKEVWTAAKEVRAANKLHDLMNGKITVEQSKVVIQKMRGQVDAEPTPPQQSGVSVDAPTNPIPSVPPVAPPTPLKQPVAPVVDKGVTPREVELRKALGPRPSLDEKAARLGWGMPLTDMAPDALMTKVGVKKNQPTIPVYRGGPGGNTLEPGDFLTTSKEGAAIYGDNVVRHDIPISDLRYFNGTHKGDPRSIGSKGPTTLVYNPKSAPPVEPPKGAAPLKQPVEVPVAVLAVPPKQPIGDQRITSGGGDVTVGDVRPKPQAEPTQGGERPVTGLNNAEIDRLRQHLDLEDLLPHEKQSFEQALSSAKSQGLDSRAVDNATEILSRPRTLSPEEHAGMVLEATKLKSEYNGLTKDIADQIDAGNPKGAELAQVRREAIELQLNIITEAADKAGTIAGRNLSIRRMLLNNDTFDLASVVQRATIRKGTPLTREEVGKYEELSKKYDEVRAKLDVAESTEAARIAAGEVERAERVIKIQEKRSAMTVRNVAKRNKILEERESIKKALRDIGYRVNDITGVTAEGAYHIGRLAINYARDGANNLSEITKRIVADIPELAHLTMRDIAEAIHTRNPNAQDRAINVIKKRVANINTESRLVLELDDMINGIWRSPKGASETTKEIASLRKILGDLKTQARLRGQDPGQVRAAEKMIADLEKQLVGGYRKIGSYPEEAVADLKSAREKIANLRKQMSSEDTIARLENQIESLREGSIPESGRKATSPTGRVVELRKTLTQLKRQAYRTSGDPNALKRAQKIISELQDQIDRSYRPIKGGKPYETPDVAAAKKKVDELRKILSHNDTVFRLENKIAQMESGVSPASKPRPVQARDVQLLQEKIRQLRSQAFKSGASPQKLANMIRKINDVQDQLSGQWRHIGGVKKLRPPTTAELETLRANLKNLRETMNNKDELANLEEQLRTGNIVAKVDPPKRDITPELLKSRMELQKAKRAIQREVEMRKPTTPRKVAFEVANTLRALKATADMSSTLRQALPTLLANPIRSTRNFGKSVEAFFSNKKADEIDYLIHEMPEQFYRDKAKLELSDWSSPSVTKREEMFMDQWVERVPYLGQIFKSSNRHMVSFLNLQRVGMFDDFLHKYSNATDEELTAWAHYINVMTGRGDIIAQGKAAELLGQLFFAPRFAASRVQAPFMVANRLFRYRDLPRVSKEVAKNAASLLSTGIAALVTAQMAGLDVTMDPDDADFGKIRIGDTRVDIFAGFVQPARLLARIAEFPLDRAGITQSADKRDLQDMVYRFASMKFSPGVASAYWGLTGKDLVGREVGIDEAAINAFVPMVISDFKDAWKSQGPMGATAIGAASFIGLGASTYDDSRTATIHKIRRLMDQGDITRANALAESWNSKNPEKQEIGDVYTTEETLLNREEATQQTSGVK
jgi:uncharacterized phage infection (PIP) family protein YhgE